MNSTGAMYNHTRFQKVYFSGTKRKVQKKKWGGRNKKQMFYK